MKGTVSIDEAVEALSKSTGLRKSTVMDLLNNQFEFVSKINEPDVFRKIF